MVNSLLLEVKKSSSFQHLVSCFSTWTTFRTESSSRRRAYSWVDILFKFCALFSFCCAVSSWLPGRLSSWSPRASRRSGLSRHRAWAPGRVGARDRNLQAQQLWPVGLLAPRPVGSSPASDQTPVSCITGRQVLYHWASKEAPSWYSTLPRLIYLQCFLFISISKIMDRKLELH